MLANPVHAAMAKLEAVFYRKRHAADMARMARQARRDAKSDIAEIYGEEKEKFNTRHKVC